jgi:hypothetical protein
MLVSHNCAAMDEINFAKSGVSDGNVLQAQNGIMDAYRTIRGRITSRFIKNGVQYGRMFLISSKQSDQDFVDAYIKKRKADGEDKAMLVIDEPQWVIRDDKGSPNDKGAFYVAIGNKFLASELLPLNATDIDADLYRQRGYSLIKVPPGYREAFEDDIDTALTDIAGISTANSMKYISGVRLNEAKVDGYRNPFTKDIIEVGNAPNDDTQYSQYFDLSVIPSHLKSKPLYIHLDMSLSGDKTGIAGTWIIGKRPTKSNEDASKELMYKLAFSVSVKAPRGYQVSFEKNRTFIRWLKQQGFAIKGVSSDTYQSAQIQQQLKADGFNTEIVSVDRVDSQSKICIPYNCLKHAIYERRVEIYQKCDLLTDELIGLERNSSGKIDHTENGINSKDQADAFCGSLYLASQNAEQYAFDYGETLDTVIQVSGADSFDRKQLQIEFENELQTLFNPLKNYTNEINKQKVDKLPNDSKPNEEKAKEKPVYLDFGMGPAQVYRPQYFNQGIMWW